MTITEALAEIKTVIKRIDSKREFVKQYLVRIDNIKDPLEKDGGSEKVIAEAMQSIADLEQRLVDLRLAIQTANETNTIKIGEAERSIADWLVWRREVMPSKKRFYASLNNTLRTAREQVKACRPGSLQGGVQEKPLEVVANISDKELATVIEVLEQIDGNLDGQLSLKNATIQVEV